MNYGLNLMEKGKQIITTKKTCDGLDLWGRPSKQ
jgi:hypothetical protein